MRKRRFQPRLSHHRKVGYRSLMFALGGIGVALLLSRWEAFHTVLTHLGTIGYFGAFLAGILSVFTFTVATSVLVLLILAETLSPLEIGLVAGLGAVAGDLFIFRFIRSNLMTEMSALYHHVDPQQHIKRVLHGKYFHWILPLLGMVIIASPLLPDELGVSLMGLSKISTPKFILLSYVLNALGIFLIISAATAVRI